MHKRLLQLVAMLVAAMLLLAACGGGDDGGSEAGGDSQDATEDTGDTGDTGDDADSGEATYTAVDFGFQGPETLPAGKTTLTLKNDGKEPHMMALIQLLEGKTIDDVMAYIEKNGIGGKPPSWAKQAGGIGGVKPGDTKTGGANLKPGSYVAMCFVTSKKNDNKPHVALGMILPITVE